jgi:hypothetical protein
MQGNPPDLASLAILDANVRDETGHVAYAVKWFKFICQERSLGDPIEVFHRYPSLSYLIYIYIYIYILYIIYIYIYILNMYCMHIYIYCIYVYIYMLVQYALLLYLQVRASSISGVPPRALQPSGPQPKASYTSSLRPHTLVA